MMRNGTCPWWPVRMAALLALLGASLAARPATAQSPAGPAGVLSAGYAHTCALTPAGAADCWGDNTQGQATDQAGPFTALSAGGQHTCALTPAGAVDCWGDNAQGQATDQAGPFTALSAGYTHTCALTSAGAVDCWGDNGSGQAQDQVGPFIALSAGGFHSCALTSAGVASCWGNNGSGQTFVPVGSFTAIRAGGAHTCALTPAGAADCWGDNAQGEATDQPGPFGPPAPEIGVSGQAQPISSGDTTPSLHDGTYFGATPLGTASERSFAIENTGTTPLYLLGAQPITIGGPHAADFVVLASPVAPIAPGARASVTVRFQPSAANVRSAVVTIATNDADEGQFTFHVAARGGTTALFVPLTAR